MDSGYGLSKENQSKLFKEVVQFNANVQQGGGGTGLGLWLTKNIVDLHGGRVGMHSEGEGMGCTFFLEIPITLCDVDDEYINQSNEAPSSHLQVSNQDYLNDTSANSFNLPVDVFCKSKHPFTTENASRRMDSHMEESEGTLKNGLNVLVVDDSALNRKMTSRVLRSLGHSTMEAEDGRVAIAVIAGSMLEDSSPIDVILMDNCNVLDVPIIQICYNTSRYADDERTRGNCCDTQTRVQEPGTRIYWPCTSCGHRELSFSRSRRSANQASFKRGIGTCIIPVLQLSQSDDGGLLGREKCIVQKDFYPAYDYNSLLLEHDPTF